MAVVFLHQFGFVPLMLNAINRRVELLSGSEAHDAWFRTKVLEASNDTRPDLSDDEVEAHFAKRRTAVRLKAGASES